MTSKSHGLLFLLALLSTTLSLGARVISYSPYTDRVAIPAQQDRTNRYFVLLEAAPAALAVTQPLPNIWGQAVLYDSLDEFEPRVIYPTDGTLAIFSAAAVREDENGIPVVLIQTMTNSGSFQITTRLSNDAGRTWKLVPEVNSSLSDWNAVFAEDVGGPFVRGRFNRTVRIGNEQIPFVVLSPPTGKVFGVDRNGAVQLLHHTPTNQIALAGRDREGRRFLVTLGNDAAVVNSSGSSTRDLNFAGEIDGWITPDGDLYITERASQNIRLWHVRGDVKTQIGSIVRTGNNTNALFAVPTLDYTGAWVIQRAAGSATRLSLHTPSAGLLTQWDDIIGPEVEALHVGSSGEKLLIQVHKPRPAFDVRPFIDPALAIWRVGDPAPRQYDELYLNEQPGKAFVHLDVETVESGGTFVFDSGIIFTGGGGGGVSAGGGGGGDVVQEWGVVRGSLRQRLVLPSVGRTPGAFGSQWASDVIVYNPYDHEQKVEVRYVPTGTASTAAAAGGVTLELAPREIRLIGDAVKTLFGVEQGLGAFFFTPEESINVSSRTYSQSATGSFGFGMNAIDTLAGAASPRFALTFSGAFPSNDFRTNLVLTSVSSRESEAALSASGVYGAMGLASLMFRTPALTQQQFNNVNGSLGLLRNDLGALTVATTAGSVIPSVFVIDNRTNDSTYFPPDLTAPFGRIIPVIGHIDGANNSKFRTDLYAFNSSTIPRTIGFAATSWETGANLFMNLTLLPGESRVFRDAAQSIFGLSGLARLRYQSAGADANGVRVTSRTYSIDENGGTYGFLMPPLNNFQMGSPGDTLEILGAVADPAFRTNIGLVDASPFGTGQLTHQVRIEIIDRMGRTADSFTASVPAVRGTQLNDVFGARTLAVTGPVLIRISPLSGVIGGYATMTDNGTNDSIYLAANLAAQP